MKTIGIMFLLFVSACYAKQTSNSIKIVREYSFKNDKTGEILNQDKLSSESHFDMKGKKTELVLFDSAENLTSIFIYKYDTLGNCISIVEYDKNREKINEDQASIDKNGKIIPFWLSSSCDFCKQKSPYVKCKYDNKGNVIEAVRYDEVYKEMITTKIRYEYEYW